MLYRIDNSLLVGIRFLDEQGLLLLAVGNSGDSCWSRDPNYEFLRSHSNTPFRFKQFEIREGHWLVGAKSSSKKTKFANHYDFQFYLGFIETPE